MGGGGVVEMVEMVEMYLQNKYTKTQIVGNAPYFYAHMAFY